MIRKNYPSVMSNVQVGELELHTAWVEQKGNQSVVLKLEMLRPNTTVIELQEISQSAKQRNVTVLYEA